MVTVSRLWSSVLTFAALVLVAIIAATPGTDYPQSRPDTNTPQPRVGVINIGGTEGIASYYQGSRGFHGIAHVAVQDGRWTGRAGRMVEVCIRGYGCEILPVVDYCQCHRGTDRERIVDLSIRAVRLFGLDTSAGIWHATLREIES